MDFPTTFAELKAAGAAQGLASNAPGNAGVVGDTVGGEILRGHGPRRGGLERLLRYWRPIMKRPGGFRQCVLELADHPELGPDVRPLCAWLHHETTGKWPNEGNHHGAARAGIARRIIDKPGKSVSFEDILTDDLIDKLVIVAKSIDMKEVETKKAQPITASHLIGIGAQGRATGALIPDLLQDEGWKPNPIRSARGSILRRPLSIARLGGAGGLPGGGAKRQIHRCPAGFQFGGRFANNEMSNCGERLFDLSAMSGKPGSLIPDLGVADTGKQNTSLSGVLKALADEDDGPYLIRADGVILKPLMAPGRLSAFKATKDTEDAIYVAKGTDLSSLGREEVRLLGIGVKTVIIVLPDGEYVRVDRKGKLPPGFGRQVGALTRSATAGSNPLKRVADASKGQITYTDSRDKGKSVERGATVWLGEKGLGGAIGGRVPYLKPAVLDLGAPDGDGDNISQERTTAAHATVHAPEPPKPAATRKKLKKPKNPRRQELINAEPEKLVEAIDTLDDKESLLEILQDADDPNAWKDFISTTSDSFVDEIYEAFQRRWDPQPAEGSYRKPKPRRPVKPGELSTDDKRVELLAASKNTIRNYLEHYGDQTGTTAGDASLWANRVRRMDPDDIDEWYAEVQAMGKPGRKPPAASKPRTGGPRTVRTSKTPKLVAAKNGVPKVTDKDLLEQKGYHAKNQASTIRSIVKYEIDRSGYRGNEWHIPQSGTPANSAFATKLSERLIADLPQAAAEMMKPPATITNAQKVLGILKTGRFKSLFEFEPDTEARVIDRMTRTRVETYMGIAPDADANMRPIYGLPYSAEDYPEGLSGNTGLAIYGDTVIHFKEDVTDKATVSFGDTYQSLFPVPWADVAKGDVLTPEDILGATSTAWAREFAASYLEVSRVGYQRHDDFPMRGNYLEAQFHGGMSLSDIDHIDFSQTKFSEGQREELGGLLDELGIAHNISVDGSGSEDHTFSSAELQQMPWGELPSVSELYEKLDDYAENPSKYDTEKAWEGDDLVTDWFAKSRGFDEKPTVVSRGELDRLIEEEGWTEVFRGVTPEGAEMFKSGPYAAGMGTFGGGFYATTSREHAQHYMDTSGGVVMRMAIPPTAEPMASSDDVYRLLAGYSDEAGRHTTLSAKDFERLFDLSPWGKQAVWPITMGYDYTIGTEDKETRLIYNRSMMAVEE